MLDEYETLQFQGVFTDDQPGKFFKTHNITNNSHIIQTTNTNIVYCFS